MIVPEVHRKAQENGMRPWRWTMAVLLGINLSSAAAYAEYPDRTVDLVIPYASGGGIDLLLRALGEGLSTYFKQSFVVLNRPGAGGAIGANYVARATPDGYTLLFVPALVYSVLPMMQDNIEYTEKSFTPICQTFENQMALIVPPGSPFRTTRDIVEAAKAKPDSVSYAATAAGSITHLAVAALGDVAQVRFNHVPFRGDGEIMGQLMGGHVAFASTTLASAAAAGSTVRVIAIFAENRNPSAQDVPTVKEQGYDVAPTSFGGLFAPAGLAGDFSKRLEDGCKFAVAQPTYVNLAKQFHQGDKYYADSEVFARRLDADVIDKKQLLRRIGLVK